MRLDRRPLHVAQPEQVRHGPSPAVWQGESPRRTYVNWVQTLGCVTIDTTVQPKAVSHPTGRKLTHRGIEILCRLARQRTVALRQSYTRASSQSRSGSRTGRRLGPCGRGVVLPVARSS